MECYPANPIGPDEIRTDEGYRANLALPAGRADALRASEIWGDTRWSQASDASCPMEVKRACVAMPKNAASATRIGMAPPAGDVDQQRTLQADRNRRGVDLS